jgi:hypothetical protein
MPLPKSERRNDWVGQQQRGDGLRWENTHPASGRIKRKLCEKELRKLQVQLCHLQQWVKLKIFARLSFSRDATAKMGTGDQ